MAAVVPNKVETIDARVDNMYGTTPVAPRMVYIDVTGSATSNTIDVNTYTPCNGILGVLMNSLDGATITTAPTWSSTTLTLANDGGSHAIKMVILVY
jgi:hypothetical protein